MAMALVVVGFGELFKDLGTVSSLVKAKDISHELVNSVFLLNLAIGALVYVGIHLCASTAARAYGQPELTNLLSVLALTLLISAFSLTKRALLLREMRFGRLAAIDLVAALVGGIVAVSLAVGGFGVWSLVTGTLCSSCMTSALLWCSSSWRPSASCQLGQLRSLAHFSLHVTGSGVFSYFISQTDKLLIGLFLGEVALGLYAMAQRLMEIVLSFITAPVSKVLFPAFARIQDDNGQIALLYTKACGGIAFVAFPFVAGLGFLAEPFVMVVIGEKWGPAIPLMGILSVPTMLQSLAMTVGTIYMAKSKPHWLLGWQISAGLLTTCSYLAGLRWGVTGVASAYALVILVLTYPAFAIPFHLIGFAPKTFARSLLPYLVGTLVMLGVLALLKCGLSGTQTSPVVALVLSAILGAVIYVAAMSVMRPPAISDIAELLCLRRSPDKVDGL
jgi:PST family polysaccharide transporter